MPFDNTPTTTRPYIRLGTAELAALVDAGTDLAGVAAELAHRDRKPARLLAERVAALMVADMAPALVTVPCQVPNVTGEPSPAGCFPGWTMGTREVPADHPLAVAALPPAEVVECVHGALVVPEVVVSVERVEAVEPVAPRFRFVLGQREVARSMPGIRDVTHWRDGAREVLARLDWNDPEARARAAISVAVIRAEIKRRCGMLPPRQPIARTTTIPPTKAPPAAPKPSRNARKAAAVPAVDPGHLEATSEFGRAYAEAVAACRAADSSLAHWFRETMIVKCAKVDRGFGMSPRVRNGVTHWERTIKQRRVPAARYWPAPYAAKVAAAVI